MAQFLGVIIALSILFTMISAAATALYLAFLYILLPALGLFFVYKIIQAIYHELNPEAKKKYKERKEKEAIEARIMAAQKEAAAKEKKEQEEAEKKRKEREHQQRRDGDFQAWPYTYQVGQHANEALAIRYGIANLAERTQEYWYYGKGGERMRNPERDKVFYEPATVIRLQKTRRIGKDKYKVVLSDFGNREAVAIIESGKEYVKTFYPLDDDWFIMHADLERALKNNGSFTLKELATFHIQKTVRRYGDA